MAVIPTMRPAEASDSDDEKTLQASDEDVLRDEDDTERLIKRPGAGVTALLGKSRKDPNQPRSIVPNKREERKERRRERRAKRRQDKREDEASLMYNMEEGGGEGGVRHSDDSSSTSSDELYADKLTTKNKRRTKLLHFAVLPVTVLSILVLLVYGAYVMSGKRRARTSTKSTLRSNGTHTFASTTILVSLDGFRADFLSRGLTPTLNRFLKEGVSPRYMLPSFPSVTFPNHWTLVTGLYPESHGIVGNQFWDPAMQEHFINTVPEKSMFPKWWTSSGAEAIWSTAEKQGVRTAIHMWPGSEAHIQPEPTYVDKFNGSEILSRKVDRVLDFMDRPSQYDQPSIKYEEARPQFVALYVPDVDSDGHLYGPNSTEIRSTIQSVDSMLEDIFEGLKQRNLTDIVNVVVVSDHGMATTSNDRLVQLEDMIDIEDIEHIDGWPLYGLRPKAGVDVQVMYEKLKDEAVKHTHFQVYLRETMPQRWHFSKSDRIAPLWIIPETGWAIVHKEDFDVAEAKKDGSIYHPRGLHGYDHEHPLMRAIFVARGPAFPHKPNSRLNVFQNTEVYNIVCDSLEIEPKANNGTLRLPLTPIGLHSDEKEEEVPADLPSSTASIAIVSTKTTTKENTAQPTKNATGAAGKTEHIETHQDNAWEGLINKIKDAFHHIADVFKNKEKETDGDE